MSPTIALLVSAPVFFSTLSAAKPKNEHPAHEQPAHGAQLSAGISTEPWMTVTISTEERELIREHYHAEAERSGLPPGLQKKQARGRELPPGWQKKLSAGEILPREVFAEAEALPPELVHRLPRPPDGTITVVIEGKVVRLLKATREILDVFDL